MHVSIEDVLCIMPVCCAKACEIGAGQIWKYCFNIYLLYIRCKCDRIKTTNYQR